MTKNIELLAGYWTLAGDSFPMAKSEVSPLPLRERIEAAAWAGYKGMGLLHPDIMANAARIGLQGIKRLLDDNGLVHVEVELLGDWFKTGAARAASDRVRRELLEAASVLGARDMKVMPEISADSCDIPQMAAAFAELCADARAAGTNVALEIMPFTNVRTIDVAATIVAQAGQANGGLCIDIWHIVRGNLNYAEISHLPPEYIKSVELNDAASDIVGSLWDDTFRHRLYCGEGSFDCPAFIEAVVAAGFRGFYSVEILNERYRKLPLREQARRSFDGTMAQFLKLN